MGTSGMGWPNRITIGRIILVLPFVICLILVTRSTGNTLRWLTLGIFAVMALSDFFDGYLARRLKQESVLGRILDPVADKLLVTAAVFILWFSGIQTAGDEADTVQTLRLPGWVAGIIIGKDVFVVIGVLAARLASISVRLQARMIGKCATTGQLAMVFAMLLWPDLPPGIEPLPRLLWWAASALTVAAMLDYLVLGIRAARDASIRSKTA